MDEQKREVRTLAGVLSVREQGDASGESRTIAGTAIVFNVESEVLDEHGTRFREIIKPEACTMEFLGSQDIKLNLLHERELAIGRSNRGTGNLRLSVDDTGVHFELEAPRCDLGDRALSLVRAGVYTGCSFEFYPEDYQVVESATGDVTITHTRFRKLTGLTIGMDPAYKQTSVNVRELVAHHAQHEEQARESEEGAEDTAAEEAAREAEVRRTWEYYSRQLEIEND